jgi:UDP-N-acetyl-D-mannosaminuronic acid dehydrogenase
MRSDVCVIGLGRIGLPIALTTADKGHHVYGVDIDSGLVKELKEEHLRFFEPGLGALLKKNHDRFTPTTSLEEGIRRSTVVLCCVGTRRYATNKPNLGLLWKVMVRLEETDLYGKLIILKTTVPIGTTRKVVHHIAASTGLSADRDFYAAFSPERIVEGKAVEELRSLPAVVGAVGPTSLKRAARFYGTMHIDVESVGSLEAAEFLKLIDNTYRITKFAYSNDIALIAERLGLNVYDIIDAANRGYPRNSIPYPSCGVSGYCLTKDPYYLEEAFQPASKDRGFASLWITARKSYDIRTRSVPEQVHRILANRGRRAKQCRILVCGLAFKANVDDVRDSHGLAIAEDCRRRKMKVSVWDPYISNKYPHFSRYNDADEAFRGKDAAIFTVAHEQFINISSRIRDLAGIMRTPLVYDGAGVLRKYYGRKDLRFMLIGTGFAGTPPANKSRSRRL